MLFGGKIWVGLHEFHRHQFGSRLRLIFCESLMTGVLKRVEDVEGKHSGFMGRSNR